MSLKLAFHLKLFSLFNCSADNSVPIFSHSLYRDHFTIFGPYLVSILLNWSLFCQNGSSNIKYVVWIASLSVDAFCLVHKINFEI